MRQKRLEEDRKRLEAEAKQRAEVAAKVGPYQLDATRIYCESVNSASVDSSVKH